LARVSSHDKVLEVGTGSGYQTALLAVLAGQVFSIERIPALANTARQILSQAGIRNVTVLVGDGTLGWRPYAPFDAILIAAASPEVPEPLLQQLAPGGRLIIPLGDRQAQVITLVTRHGDEFQVERLSDVRFVPLLGEHGFAEQPSPPRESGWNY
jgi:protein-L-isoaspartate(D-aspartate) O-methyltransferase